MPFVPSIPLVPFATAAPHAPEAWITWLFAGLLALMITALALEEQLHAKKSAITGLFAIIALLGGTALGLLPFGDLTLPNGHHVTMPVYIPAVDWGVISIILGASLFVDVVSRSGIFTWTAIRLTRLSGGDPFWLLTYYAILTVAFSAVLNNVTAMIIVGSLTAVSLGKLGRRDLMLGFLLTEGLLTNIGGLLTLISSVPNIILGQLAGIAFLKFLYVAAPYTLAATAVTVAMAVWWFKIEPMSTEVERRAAAELVAGFDERDGIESQSFFNASWVMLGLFIAVLAGTQTLPVIQDLGMGFVAMAFAAIALLKYKHEVERSYQAFDWDLLFFFVYLFVVINVAEHAGVLDKIGESLGGLIALGERPGGAALLWSSALASSVTDNVPLAAVLGKILAAHPDVSGGSSLWWSCIFGCNLGGNFTPIGSASTVVAVSVMHKHGLKISFKDFVLQAAPFALVHVALATVYVAIYPL
ncbi:MAG TPA: hypothetical protein ENK18_13155 [Deltaproteobacteria bacterium]|nr:hypothetical protein [Deltaproteobacteria bacterium]